MVLSTPPPVPLSALAEAAAGARVIGDREVVVRGVFQDSRKVLPGSLFAIRKGEKTSGAGFLEDALARGAVAILTDDEGVAARATVPAVVVEDARAALAEVSNVAYGKPFDHLSVVGITGTNGKTTTAYLAQAMMSGSGSRPAVLGTLGTRFEGEEIPGTHTTPESDELSRLAALLVSRGATHLVMEVSSHALSLSRVEAVPFAVAAFTNLSQDHLDFHGTLQAYGEAKARLFVELAPGTSVLNVDDPFGRALAERAKGKVLRISTRGAEAEVRAERAQVDGRGVRATFVTPQGNVELASALVGQHNLENLAVALGIGIALGIPAARAADALGGAPPVPGRLERCDGPDDDVLVLVDYAHTPDALERVLAAVRPLTRGKLVCVFGCGGDRDPDKRPKMGKAAAKGADRLIVTNDNPRSERPEDIADAILAGVRDAGGAADIELDRARAIESAVLSAAPGDTVLIAGKGHEPYQITGGITRPFDDRSEARRALTARRSSR
jgi:UDP-N-acetylmuramoyl-L-alanyl-D-glutamate--2,6-diaminopimelate ligase